MTMNELNTILVDYINKNKSNNNIGYMETIKAVEDLLKEIKRDYETLEYYKEEQESELTL